MVAPERSDVAQVIRLMYCDAKEVMMMNQKQRTTKKEAKVRTTVSMPVSTYEKLEKIATAKKVSIGWVIRESLDKYLTSQKSNSQAR
jgi:hypothetical protein